jgi:MFS superfamily sulfate permease-like transporter
MTQNPAPPGGGPTWPRDLLASIVVFLVALPLCMGVAIASGVPPAFGLITGVVGGLIVGSLAGSPLQVSGPAAGLTVLIWDFLRPYAERHEPERGLALLGVAVLIAGALQLTMGLLKLGQWFRAVSPAVIHGMLAGIGMLIFASQFHVMVDDDPKGSGLQNLLHIPEAVMKGLVPGDGPEPHHWAARVGVLTIAVIVLWKAFAPKRLQLIPAPLLAVLAGAGLSQALGLGIEHVTIPPLSDAFRWPDLGILTTSLDAHVIRTGIAIGLIASAETLLCATAVDKMHSGPRTKYDQELAAQGVGNILCGLLGALPMTGVIVRSAANVEAGARTRLSTMLHGLWLLLAIALFGSVLEMVPKAALAAILVFTGYKLMDPKAVRELWRYSKSEAAIYAVTFGTIVATDLLTGVVAGVVLSAVKLLYTFSHLAIRLEEDAERGRTVMHLEGAATFIRLPKLAAALEKVPATTELHVHMERLSYIDHACLDLLMNWEKQHEATGGSLVIDWDSLTARFHGSSNGSRPRDDDHAANGRSLSRAREVAAGSPSS